MGVTLMDIDNYKGYNDTYGHLEGDMCLKHIADALKQVLDGHFYARYGGDEFICLFVGSNEFEVKSLLERLAETMAKKAIEHIANKPYGIVTLSQGAVVRIAKAEDTFEKLILEADENLYTCKENGRNGIVLTK